MPATTLDYLSPASDQRLLLLLNRQRRFLRFCTFFPMSTGVAILLLYWLFDLDFLPTLGLLMLPTGALIVCVGMILFIFWAANLRTFAKRANTPTPALQWLRVIVPLLANFPVAFLCMMFGFTLVEQPRILVTIQNDSGIRVDSCRIHSTWSFGDTAPIPPGAEHFGSIKLSRARNLIVTLSLAGTTQEIPLPSASAQQFTLHIHPDPSHTITIDSTPTPWRD